MSNRVNIVVTKFTDVRVGTETFGIRIWDDCACNYDDTWKEIPDDDLEVLRLALVRSNRSTQELLEFVRDAQHGVYISGSWYDWAKIKPVFEQAAKDLEAIEKAEDLKATEDLDRRQRLYGPEHHGGPS